MSTRSATWHTPSCDADRAVLSVAAAARASVAPVAAIVVALVVVT